MRGPSGELCRRDEGLCGELGGSGGVVGAGWVG